MTPALKQLILTIRDHMKNIPPHEREDVISELQKGYCSDCMREEPDGEHCYCTQDD